jgi:hypothetical protein
MTENTPSAERSTTANWRTTLFHLATFLSSTLLFSLQPLIAKTILPWFGGGAGIWNICQLFFQGGLLLGYLYAHKMSENKNLRYLHPAILCLSLLSLPIIPSASWKDSAQSLPELKILALLTCTVGLPYTLLSCSSPLLATLFKRNFPSVDPYKLFAWSNLGSMLGLLSYPVLIEPNLGLVYQARCWSALFVLYAIIVAGLVMTTPQGLSEHQNEGDDGDSGPKGDRFQWNWLFLPALSSLILTTATHHISSELAPIPLLWCVPLAFYLLSYIFVSSSYPLFSRRLVVPLTGIAIFFYPQVFLISHDPAWQIGQSWVSLLLIFVALHGELWAHRPSTKGLTTFYLWMSLGGGLGTVVSTIIAPWMFPQGQELSLAMLSVPLTLWVLYRTELAKNLQALSFVVTIGVIFWVSRSVVQLHVMTQEGLVLVQRNFYGRCIVFQKPDHRSLVNGVTCHGVQYDDDARSLQPSSYFSETSGVGRTLRVMQSMTNQPIRSGVIGLGIGILASYNRPQDSMVIYEIDPKVIDIAKTSFRYLKQAKGKVEVVAGDARIQIEKSTPQLELLVVDAFSGDAIPTHLLDREALRLYGQCVNNNPNSAIAVHITNRYLSLNRVVSGLARDAGLTALIYSDGGNLDKNQFPSVWMVMVKPDSPLLEPLRQQGFQVFNNPGIIWTDDYTSIFEVLNF